jgi:nuclear pore complex protein Nup160
MFEMNQNKKSGWQIPVWLADWEMQRDSEGWVSRALRWGWVEEAVDWTAELVRRVSCVPCSVKGWKGELTI